MLGHLFSDLWEGLISRTTGPLKFRFVLQPSVSIFLAIRSGIQDWRERKPPFFWEFVEDPACRRELWREGWKSIGKLFIFAVLLDCIYQVIELHWIYPVDALAVAFFLAMIPYWAMRGPVNRIATAIRRPRRPSLQRPTNGPAPVRKAGI